MSEGIAIIIATALGPIAAVLITLWHQDRAQKRQAKERLFLTLMAHRRSSPPTYDWSQSLNLIDVVYADTPKVVHLWHELYDILSTAPYNHQRYSYKHLELLSEMAQRLGYRRLTQADIDKYYSPQAHGDQAMQSMELGRELLRVLKATERLPGEPRRGDQVQ